MVAEKEEEVTLEDIYLQHLTFSNRPNNSFRQRYLQGFDENL
jgi:hypothetical protein